MTRRRRRGSRAPAGQIAAIVALGLGIVVVAGGFVYLLVVAQQRYVATDPQTLCPLSGVVAQTIVLLDTTDAFSEVTRADALNKLDDVTGAIPKGGLLDVRVLNEDPNRIARIMSLCNPGDGKDLDPVTANPQRARERWQERFAGPVEQALRDAVAGTEQSASPILAAIQQIAAERASSAGQQAIPTRIVVVSDMLEHTGHYSHFRDGVDFASYERLAGARYLTDLAGAGIEFWMVQRDRDDIERTALAAFWLRWAEASNGEGKVVRLMGMQ